MSSFLKPSTWFRKQPGHDTQSGTEKVAPNTVISCKAEDADGFLSVEARPMTYAEASCTIYPAAHRKICCSEPYSSIDDSKLAVQMVNEYESQTVATKKSPVSMHVIANMEYSVDNIPFRRDHKRKHKRKRATA